MGRQAEISENACYKSTGSAADKAEDEMEDNPDEKGNEKCNNLIAGDAAGK